MSTTPSTNWASFEKLTATANRRNKKLVFEALAQAGITRVCVSFDGEGDSGQIENVSAQTEVKTVEFPPVTVTLHLAEYGASELVPTEMNLQDAVERLCYGYLEQEHGGWENNDGAYGEFTFDVAARTITLDFYGRIVDTAYDSHTF
jgi:hypothetical protein